MQSAIPAQSVGQFGDVVSGDFVACDFIGDFELLIIPVVESGDGYRDRSNPVADGKILFDGFCPQLSNAYDSELLRDFEGEVIESALTETDEVGIRRSAGADIEAFLSG